MFERLVLYLSDSEDYVDLAIISLFFTILSVFLVRQVVPFQVGGQQLAGVMVVLLTSLAVAYPFVRHLLIREHEEAENRWSEKRLLKRHAEDFTLYLSFFLGTTFAFAISTFFVPEDFYSVQMQVLESINAPTGNFILDPGLFNGIINTGFFMRVLENNLWVFMVTFILAFFVTSGILFVLVWNASVLGVHIGANLSNTLFHVPLHTLPFLPHGILEIGGYILAGIAGSLLSYEAENLLFEQEEGARRAITKDAIILTGIGAILILAGALVEALPA